MVFFCFKQKTAYEMRISDWSSDVCSSDLRTSSRPPTSTHAEAMQRTGDIAVKDPRTNVFDLDRVSLERFFEEELGDKKFRAHQVMKWIHHRHATGFEEMTDLGKALRARLEERDRKSTRLNSSH